MPWTDPFAPAPPLGAADPYKEEEKQQQLEQEVAEPAESDDENQWVQDDKGAYWPMGSALAPRDIPESQYKEATGPLQAAGAGLSSGADLLGGSMWKLLEIGGRIERNIAEGIDYVAPEKSPLKKLAKSGIALSEWREDQYRELADFALIESQKKSAEIGDNFSSKAIGLFTQAAPSLLPALATGGLGGGTTAVALAAGAQSLGMHANQAESHLTQHYIELGMSQEDAKIKAAHDAAAPSIFAAAATSALVKYVPLAFGKVTGSPVGYGGAETLGTLTKEQLKEGMKIGLGRFMGRGFAGEAVEESLDEIYQGYTEMRWWNPDKTHEEVLEGGILAGIVGGFLGGGMSGISLAALQQSFKEESGQRAARAILDKVQQNKNTPATNAAIEQKAEGGAAPAVSPAEVVSTVSDSSKESISGILPQGDRFESKPIDGGGDENFDASNQSSPITEDSSNVGPQESVATTEEIITPKGKAGYATEASADRSAKSRGIKDAEHTYETKQVDGNWVVSKKPVRKGKTSVEKQHSPETNAEVLEQKINNLTTILNERGAGNTEAQRQDVAKKKAELQEAQQQLEDINKGKIKDEGAQVRLKGQGPEAKKAAVNASLKAGNITQEEADLQLKEIEEEAASKGVPEGYRRFKQKGGRAEEKIPVGTKVKVGSVKQWLQDSSEEYRNDVLQGQAEEGVEFTVERSNGNLISGNTEDGTPVVVDASNKDLFVSEAKPEEKVEDKPEGGEDTKESQESDPEEEVDQGPDTVTFGDDQVIVDTSSVNNSNTNVQGILNIIEEHLPAAINDLELGGQLAVVLDPNSGNAIEVNPYGEEFDVIIINPDMFMANVTGAARGDAEAARWVAGLDVIFEEEIFHLVDLQAMYDQYVAEQDNVAHSDRRIQWGDWYDAKCKRIFDGMSAIEKSKVIREYLGYSRQDWAEEWKWIHKEPRNKKERDEKAVAIASVESKFDSGMDGLRSLVAGEYVRMRMQQKRGKRREDNEKFYNNNNKGLGEWLFIAKEFYWQGLDSGVPFFDSKLIKERVANAIALLDKTGVDNAGAPVKKVSRSTKDPAVDVEAKTAGLSAKRVVPSFLNKGSRRFGPVKTGVDVEPLIPYNDPEWNGLIAREQPKGATNSEEYAAWIYKDVRDFIGADNPVTNRSGITFDDTQIDDAVHWIFSRTFRDAQEAAGKNVSLKNFAYYKQRGRHLVGYLRHITGATKELGGGLVTMSEEQLKEADPEIVTTMNSIDTIDSVLAEETDKDKIKELKQERRALVGSLKKLQRDASRQRYKRINLDAEVEGDEEGSTWQDIIAGDIVVSGATQNIESSERNRIIRERIQEIVESISTAEGAASEASVRMSRVVDMWMEGRTFADIARSVGAGEKTVRRDFEKAKPIIANYLVERGWASRERWTFAPSGLSGEQGGVRASFDVRTAKSTVLRSSELEEDEVETDKEAASLRYLKELFGSERVFLHDDMQFRRVRGGLGAKNITSAAADKLGVKDSKAAVQKELMKPSNPKIAGLSDEDLTTVVIAGEWSHGTSPDGQAAIDSRGFIAPAKRLATVVPAIFMAADSDYAAGYGTVGKYGVDFDSVLNGDSPSVDANGNLHPAVNAAFNVVAGFWAKQVGGFRDRFAMAKQEAIDLYASPERSVAQAIEDVRFLADNLPEDFGEIDPFTDDVEARLGIAEAIRGLDYQAIYFTHPDTARHVELAILRETDTDRSSSYSTNKAIRSLRTGSLAAASLGAKDPSAGTFLRDIGAVLDQVAENSKYQQFNSWMSIGGEDILMNHPNKNVRALAPLIRQHYDTRQALEAKLLEGINAAEDGLTINERDIARKEFHDYIAIREADQNIAKVSGSGTHSKEALQKAEEFYENMSESGKALVDWVRDTAEMTGGINESLDVHVKDKAKGGKWRPIGNLGLLHFPRMLTPKTARTIFEWSEADGVTYTEAYSQLLHDMVSNGNAATTNEAHEQLQSVNGINHIASNEFLEGVELARGLKLPDINSTTGEPYYDYSINGYVNFISRYADRIAQIQTFGQSRGGTMTTAWDVFLGKKTSGPLKDEVETIKQAIEGTRVKSPVSNWMLSVAGLGLLGSPLGSLRNFYTGVFFTMEQAGVVKGASAAAQVAGQYTMSLAKAFRDFHRNRKKALEGEGKVWYLTPELRGGEWSMRTPDAVIQATSGGAISQDIVNAMLLDIQDDSIWNDEETVQARLRKVNRKTLFLHNVAERMARATNYVAAINFIRDNTGKIKTQSGNWKQSVAMLKRTGLTDSDIEAAMEETPWALEKLARKMVREKQYSYDVTQTPLMFHGMKSPMWKLMFQFQRWGFQRARDLSRNIIWPMIGEERVTWQGKPIGTGTSLSGKPVVRDIGPLIKMMLLSVGSGELYGLLREFFKAKGRSENEWMHIFATANSAQDRALMMFAERMVMDVATSGALGISSDYAMLTRDVATRGVRYRSPFEPPSFKIARDTIGLITNRVQRGWDGLKGEGLGDDILDYLSSYPTFHQAGVVATRMGIPSLVDSVPVAEYAVRDNPHARMKNGYEVQRLRNLIRDYSGEMNLNIRYGGQSPYNENTYDYRRMRNSLSAGDINSAVKVKKTLLSEADNKVNVLRGIKQSVRQSQPLNAYGVKSDVERKNFVKWLRTRLGNAEANQLLEVQRRYIRTAKQAGVMD